MVLQQKTKMWPTIIGSSNFLGCCYVPFIHFLPVWVWGKFRYLKNDEELVLSYNKVHKPLEAHDKKNCSISILNILTRVFYAKIGGNDPDVGISCRNQPNASQIQSTVEEALEDVSTIFYEAERNEIYTGTTGGLVHIWSN